MGVVSYLNKSIALKERLPYENRYPEFNNGTELYLNKNIEMENPGYHNANEGPLGFIGSGIDLINNIIGQATGTTAATIQAQREQAAALQAQAAAQAASIKNRVKIALIVVGGVVLIGGGVIFGVYYLKNRKK